MTYKELLDAVKAYDLNAIGASLGKPAEKAEAISCFKDGDEWVMQEIDDRQNIHTTRGNEGDIVKKVYGNTKKLVPAHTSGVDLSQCAV